jgi:hypothetical protein
MALNDLELSLMTFPQNWDKTKKQINLNLLLLPVGDPTKPLGSGPAFAGTTIKLKGQFISGLDTLPLSSAVPVATSPFTAVPPPAASALFNGLIAKLPAGTTVISTKVTTAPAGTARIKKSLPASYINAFPFERKQNDDLMIGDGYGCAVRAQSPGALNPPQPAPPKIIAWGQIISFILRQPQLAQAVGLVYPVAFPLDPATAQSGGWLFFTLDDLSLSGWKAKPDSVKSYAARIPQLDKDHNRLLFSATLFPILAAPDAKYAKPQFEAEIYDDGFGQVVHCNQPETADAATLDPNQIDPGTEAGIQVGWDDEQVTVWLNRQVDLLRDRVTPGTTNAPECPLGVQGYRVDVQLKGDADFHSLCNVSGSLPFSANTNDGSGFTPSGELFITPAPVRPAPADWVSPNAEPALLPLYFAQWRGKSLVVHDNTVSDITPGTKDMPANLLTGDLTGVPILRYGNDYQFRTRFVDLTGGGPLASDAAVHPGPAPAGFCPFRRFIPPKTLEVESTPPPPKPPDNPPPVRTITQLAVRRPRIGYPEALFAGVPPAVFTGASLASLIADAQASGRALSVPDPDVDRFQVVVEARIPLHDTGTQGTLPGELDGSNYRIIYSMIEHFPDGDPDPVVTLSLAYQDTQDIAKVVAPADDSASLVIPTARDVRVRLIPLCAARSNYYGTPTPPQGLSTDYIVRKEATSEADLYNFDPPAQLKAFFFQPGNDLPTMLAQSLGLKADGLILSAVPGKRVVFGAAAGLRHTLSPEAASITFANQAELLDHWIVVLTVDLERDWSWDGFAEPAMTISRDSLSSPVGTVTYYPSVSLTALGAPQQKPDRSTTRVIFFDTISPQPAPGKFPDVLHPKYSVTASFKTAPDVTNNYDTLVLPITTRPDQTPKIVSTGIAESPFKAALDYSQTFLRDRFLWIEFEKPIADTEDDTYFGRVLGYGPDPMLAANVAPPHVVPPTDEPPLAVDPEPEREIFAGQAADFSGLNAMDPLTQAVPAGDGVHYLLPLPPNMDSEALDLFGFWTYEFRVGHQKKWCTAQARFGRPLRVTGIQHPAPHMICTAERSHAAVVATAPFATTVLNGVRLYDLTRGDPETVLWFMLYTQVLQTDGAAHRNILLSHKRGCLLPDWQGSEFGQMLSEPQRLEVLAKLNRCPEIKPVGPHTVGREPRGYTFFTQKEIQAALELLSLPQTSPLSVLAVEVLPGPFNFTVDAFVREAPGVRNAATSEGEDPLGTQLGQRRILRTSPLTPVPAIC